MAPIILLPWSITHVSQLPSPSLLLCSPYHPQNLSSLVALVEADPLVLDLLSNRDLAVTLFAPTDEAFK
jgi:uncharacterized surface protein with fasciclin (FAS1) repeats